MTIHLDVRGSSIDLKTRADLSAALVNRLMKRTYVVIPEHKKEYQHEIANHYRDYKHLTMSFKQKRRRKRVQVREPTVQRELLQIPCFVFPRFGKNFPWKGRQTLCKHIENKNILSDTLIKIHKASTPFELRTLCDRIVDGIYYRPLALHLQASYADTSKQPALIATVSPEWSKFFPLNKQTSQCVKTESNGSDITSELRSGIGSLTKILNTKLRKQSGIRAHSDPHRTNHRLTSNHKSIESTSALTIKRNNRSDTLNNNVKWYVKLASEIFEDNIQQHLDHLTDLSQRFNESQSPVRPVEALKRQSNTQTDESIQSNTANCHQLLKSYLNSNNENGCNIRIDINGIINSRLDKRSNDSTNRSTKRIPNAAIHMRGNMNEAIETINQKHHSLHSISSQSSEATDTQLDNEQQKQHQIDDLIGTLCTLKLSSATRIPLPQIVLTDYSDDASVNVSAKCSSTTSNFVTSISVGPAIIKTSNVFSNQNINGCLTIPSECHYRSESRPP